MAGRRFWQRQCNGRARGIGSVSYVFWGAYESVKRSEECRGRQVEVVRGQAAPVGLAASVRWRW